MNIEKIDKQISEILELANYFDLDIVENFDDDDDDEKYDEETGNINCFDDTVKNKEIDDFYDDVIDITNRMKEMTSEEKEMIFKNSDFFIETCNDDFDDFDDFNNIIFSELINVEKDQRNNFIEEVKKENKEN